MEVSGIRVERNSPFCCAYHLIRKCCVFRMDITIVIFNVWQLPTVLRRKAHVAVQGRKRDTLQVCKDSSAEC